MESCSNIFRDNGDEICIIIFAHNTADLKFELHHLSGKLPSRNLKCMEYVVREQRARSAVHSGAALIDVMLQFSLNGGRVSTVHCPPQSLTSGYMS